VIVVYPDANGLFNNPDLANDAGQRLRREVESDGVELRYSPVVYRELERQERDKVEAFARSVRDGADRLAEKSPIDSKPLTDASGDFADALREEIEKRFNALLGRAHVYLEPWPTVSTQDLAEREFARRRPFMDIDGTGTIGQRDALIWEGLMELAGVTEEGDTIVFVSGDKGFWDPKKKGLHPDLSDDLDRESIPRARVVIVPDIHQATITIRRLKDEITARQAAFARGLVSYATSLERQSIGWTYDAREGDLVPGQFENVEVPSAMEDATIIAVDLIGDPTIEMQSDGTAKGTQALTLTIEGNVSRDSWLLHDSRDIEVWDSINEYYVSGVVTRDVTLEATLASYEEEVDVVSADLFM